MLCTLLVVVQLIMQSNSPRIDDWSKSGKDGNTDCVNVTWYSLVACSRHVARKKL